MAGPDVLHLLYGGLGGQHRLVGDLADAFGRAGLRTAVIAYGPEAELLTSPCDWPSVDELHVVPKARRLDLAGPRRIREILRGSRARALFWHSAYAPIAVRSALRDGGLRTALFIEHQSVGLRPLAEDLRSLVGALVAPRTVVLSESFRRGHPLARLRLPGLRDAAVIPNGVDTTRFAPAPRRGPVGAEVRCVVVGRLVATRDVETALGAMAMLRDRGIGAGLEVVGDGPVRAELESVAAISVGTQLGAEGSVRFTGRVPSDEVPARLRRADIYLHPSLGEARSTALLQAWATGLPVVAARVAGIDDLVRDGEDGLLVPASDAEAMADAVQRLIDDPALAARLGAAGRRRAEAEFSIDATVRGYLAVLADADPDGPWGAALTRFSA